MIIFVNLHRILIWESSDEPNKIKKKIEGIIIKSPNHSLDIEWDIRTCPEEDNIHKINEEEKNYAKFLKFTTLFPHLTVLKTR